MKRLGTLVLVAAFAAAGDDCDGGGSGKGVRNDCPNGEMLSCTCENPDGCTNGFDSCRCVPQLSGDS